MNLTGPITVYIFIWHIFSTFDGKSTFGAIRKTFFKPGDHNNTLRNHHGSS